MIKEQIKMMTIMMRTTHRAGPLVRSLRNRALSTKGTFYKSRASTQQEIAALEDEIRSLRTVLAQQNRDYEGLSRQVQAQSTQMGKLIADIHGKVALMSAPLEALSKVANVFVQNSEPLLKFVHRFERYSKGWINKYSISALMATVLTVWTYRATMYERTSEEVAEIASRTLRQEGLQQTIQETLAVLANSPETLETLNDLLQKMLRDPLTLEEVLTLVSNSLENVEVQKSLFSLLEVVLADPALQQQAAEFLLKGLDIESVKETLDAQTQALVREVVLDDSVQQATAIGVRQSVWYSVVPSFFWPRAKDEDSLDSTRNTNGRA